MPRRTSKDYYDCNGDDDKKVGGGVCFYVNKSGLPMDSYTWERMWDHAASIHPDGMRALRGIRDVRNLPEVPHPHVPLCFSPDMSIQDKIDAVQSYMKQLQYNHTGTQFFDIKKNRPLCGLMECAKDMIRESLPIKCLEAVILSLYLTNSMPMVDRFPISFRSTFKGNVYRHVVLGLHYNGRYGALGMSRREDLMYKPFIYSQLSEMIMNYCDSYRKYWHTLDKVKIGLAVPHDAHTYATIQWRALCINVDKLTQKDICREADNFSREIRKQTTHWQTISAAQRLEKARSLSPKKPYKPATSSAPLHKPVIMPLRDRNSTSAQVLSSNNADDSPAARSIQFPPAIYPLPPVSDQSDIELPLSTPRSSTFSFTELYEIRV